MRTLHIISGRRLYPQARQAIELITQLQRCGIHAQVACEPECTVAVAAEATCAPVTHWAMDTRSGLRKLGRLRKLIGGVNPDLVHVHVETEDEAFLGIAARLAGARCVLSADAPDSKSELPGLLARRLYDRYITTSKETAERLLKQGMPASGLCRVGIAVDSRNYQPRWSTQEFRRAFDLADGEFTIGIRVNDLSRKELKQLMHLVPILAAIYAGVRFLILGEGPSVDHLRRRLKLVKLDTVVRYAGGPADWLSFLGHLDLFLTLKRDVRQSMDVLDAQAAGVPVSGFRIAHGVELLAETNRENLVASNDYEALASVVRRLIFRPKLRHKLAARATRWVDAEFSPAGMALSYLDAYARIVGRGPQSTMPPYTAA
jgi:glycosyltransferase involved in cell wall biosynthesis